MKKSLSLLLSLLLLFGAVSAGYADAGVRYRVTVTRALLLKTADILSDPVAELPRGTVVTAEETQGSMIRVKVPSEGLTGWLHLGNVTPLPDGETGLEAISVTTPPEKTVYIEGEETLDPTGLVITGRFRDGHEEALRGYTLLIPDFLTYGEKTVEVLYTDNGATFYTSFSVTVAKVPVKALTLLTLPTKTDYIEQEPLDLTGLGVLVFFTDTAPTEIYTAEEIANNPAFMLYGCHNETPGEPVTAGEHRLQLIFRYPEFAVELPFTARRRVLTDLKVATDPKSTTTYSKTEIPDLTGLTLTAIYDNGETETLTAEDCEITCDPAAFVIGKGNLVTLTFGGMSVTLDFTYLPDEPAGIRIQTPTTLTFVLGEPIDLGGLKVFTRFLSGKEVEVTDYRLSKPDPRLIGAQTLTVTYSSYADVFTIFITPYYQRGDVDYDAKVTAADARFILRAAVGLVTLTGKALQAADADRDGNLSAADARLALRAAVGLETLLIFED